MSYEPKRLIVSEANDLGLGLASARRQLPNANDMAQLAKRLAEAGITLPDHAIYLEPRVAPNPAGRAARLGLRAKIGIGLGAVAALGLGTWAGTRARPADPKPVAVLTASPAPRTNAVTPAATILPMPERRSEVTHVAPPTPAPLARPSLAEASAPVRAAASVVARTATNPTPAGVASSRRVATENAATTSNGNTVYVAPTARATPTTEIELVKQARNAVNSDPARAYALTERCRAEFPRADFGQERDYIAITALARLGRESQARALASSFRARYPRSVYISQLERLLGTE